MFKLLWSLFSRPPAPPAPIADEPAMLTVYFDAERDAPFYKFGDRRLYFSSLAQERLCRFIIATGKYPPKNVVGQIRDGEFGLYDRMTGVWYPFRNPSVSQYRRVLSIVNRDRRELLTSSPASIDGDSP